MAWQGRRLFSARVLRERLYQPINPYFNLKRRIEMASKKEVVAVSAPDIRGLVFNIEGTHPLGISRFSQKAETAMKEKQEAGSTARAKKDRKARDFDADYEAAKYVSTEGWLGMNAAAFRNGMISVSKIAGMIMTRMKLSIFTVHDGVDKNDGTPLVRIYGEPEKWLAPVRLPNGSFDLRMRVRFPQWKMRVQLEYDAGVVTMYDVANLMVRLGRQAGIGEGRPDSKDGPGIMMGLFRLVDSQEFEPEPTVFKLPDALAA
jgi:hypothetical protein